MVAGMRGFGFPLVLAVPFGVALGTPSLFWPLLGVAGVVGLGFLALRHTAGFCVAWLLIAGCSLEMTLNDLLDPAAFQTAIAVVKAAEIGLAALAALRWGARLDPVNPAWAFVAMGAVGLAHGLYPGLTVGDSLRSVAGSVAPFAFCFVRAPENWADAMLRAARWCPVVAVAGGAMLAAAGVRPLFIDSGGWRLAGLGHPAFLASVCLTGVYAALIRFYRHGRACELVFLSANFLILVLTGARAPLFYAVAVTGATLAFVASPVVPGRWRAMLLLAGAALVPPLILLAVSGDLSSVRVFALLGTDAANLSGRDYLWPMFEAVTGESPWFGWGVGAGNVIIPPDSPVARLLHTWAAHNEYLRIEVEGGQLGRALLIGMFATWVWLRTRPLAVAERRIMRLVFLALAAHAVTDNVLISTPASVQLAFAAAVFSGRERVSR